MNSSRPTSGSTNSNEPKGVLNGCDELGTLNDKEDRGFDESQDGYRKNTEEPVNRDLEKRYTPQALHYDEGIKSDSRWTFLKK